VKLGSQFLFTPIAHPLASPPYLFAVGKYQAAAPRRWTLVRLSPSALRWVTRRHLQKPCLHHRGGGVRTVWRRRRRPAGPGLKQRSGIKKPALSLHVEPVHPGLNPPVLCTQSQSPSSSSLQHPQTNTSQGIFLGRFNPRISFLGHQ
jgi:hypothetical protein